MVFLKPFVAISHYNCMYIHIYVYVYKQWLLSLSESQDDDTHNKWMKVIYLKDKAYKI